MADQATLNWQPIDKLPLIAPMIDDMLESAEEQYSTLQEARSRPYVLDDYTVGRIVEVYTTQRNDLWLYEEQLRRWSALTLAAGRRREVERLSVQMGRLCAVIDAILTLADELKVGTIERALSKSDLEIGLDFLSQRPPNEDQ